MAAANTMRDDEGRYALALEHMCVCGHTKGEHLAGKKGRSLGECIHGDTGEPCDCQKFKAARIRRA